MNFHLKIIYKTWQKTWHNSSKCLLLLFCFVLKTKICWLWVTHACNPSYSGDRVQEDHSSKSAPGK
jgi:hypothetical protein